MAEQGDAPDFNGEALLQQSREQFIHDLDKTFGERWSEFSEELCDMLFELWSRAKVGGPLPLTQDKHRSAFVEHLIDLFEDYSRLRAAAVKGTLSVCETSGLAVSTTSSGLHLDHVQGGIPKYEYGEDSEIQENLRLRLERLGLVPEPTLPGGRDEYMPALLDRATGQLGGHEYGLFYLQEIVTMPLECRDTVYWYFPDPKPGYSASTNQPHVRIVVDGEPETNEICTWNVGTDAEGRCVIDSVMVPGAPLSGTVMATYTVIRPRQ